MFAAALKFWYDMDTTPMNATTDNNWKHFLCKFRSQTKYTCIYVMYIYKMYIYLIYIYMYIYIYIPR